MINVYFDQEVPNNFRKHIEEMIRKHALLLPLWVQEVFVVWSDEPDINASMTLDEDYRRLLLTVHRELMDRPMKYQREIFIHEFCHCFNAPITNIAEELLDMMFPQGDESPTDSVRQLYEVLADKLCTVAERVNCDFTYSVSRLIDSYEKEK